MRRVHVAVLALALGLAAGCTKEPPPTPTRVATPSGEACTLSNRLVPSCGLLWGVATQPATIAAVTEIEKATERRFDLVYRYHDLKDVVPDAEEKVAMTEGRVLHLAFAARFYDEPDTVISWGDIAAGKYDSYLTTQGKAVASMGVPVFVTFEQEANQKRKLDVRGDAADFRAAWRHMHTVFKDVGATNAVWTWVMTGSEENLERAGQLWPGNDVVDWISWNAYNGSGCNSGSVKPGNYRTVQESIEPFYTWVKTQGPKLGIDPTKPMKISEMGSVLYRAEPARTADWYAQIPRALESFPEIKAVTLWASETSKACNYRFQDQPEILDAVGRAAQAPLLRLPIDTSSVKK